MFLSPAAERLLAAEAQARLRQPEKAPPIAPNAPDKRAQEAWAMTMINEAAEIGASIPNLPPSERRIALMQVAALNTTANELLHGEPAPGIDPSALAGIPRSEPRDTPGPS